jgi:pantoate--beta-alanine ligase
VLSRALRAGRAAAPAGSTAALAAAQAELDAAVLADPPLVTDYLELVDPETFRPVTPDHDGPGLLLVAASVGKTRLIDNTPLTLRTGT